MSWPKVSLKDICTFQKKSKRKAGDGLKEGKFPFYTSSQKISKYTDSPDYDLGPSLIFGTGGLPSVHITQSQFSMSGDCIAITPNDMSHTYAKFIFFYLSGNIFILEEGFKGAGLKHISKAYLENIKIPLPPLETQKQIAAVLEKADQLSKDCKLMEQELNSLAQSVFIDMFDEGLSAVNKYTLGDVASVVSGVTKGQKLGDKVTVHAPYMRVANVQAGYLSLNEIKNIEVKLSDVEKYKLEKGDVLLTEGGDHDKLGRGAIWNNEVPGCIHQNHVFRVRLDRSKYTPEWLNGYLKTSFAKRYFLKCAKKTTNLASINITQLKGLPMPDVTIKKQLEFESINHVVKAKLDVNYALLAEYEKNFNALMQKAFKGELNLKTKAA